jgi:hypothetical protein
MKRKFNIIRPRKKGTERPSLELINFDPFFMCDLNLSFFVCFSTTLGLEKYLNFSFNNSRELGREFFVINVHVDVFIIIYSRNFIFHPFISTPFHKAFQGIIFIA